MEINTSALMGAMRIGLQVVSALKRPSVEVFSELRNTTWPLKYRGHDGVVEEMERQETHVSFFAVNIGGRHAENVTFDMSESIFQRPHGRSWGERVKAVTPVMSPGQAQFLFLLDTHEFERHEANAGTDRLGGWRDEAIVVVVRFDGPSDWTNGAQRWVANRLRKRPQYRFRYVFNPLSIVGDLPPVARG